MEQELKDKITTIVSNYTPIDNGDPNTIDVLHIAENLGNAPSLISLSKDEGYEVVECVEQIFYDAPYSCIRNLKAGELINELDNLLKCLNGKLPDDFADTEKLIASLSLWHGCLCMAKSTRIEDSGGQKYTSELRDEEYETLKQQWTEAEQHGNNWVKQGVSLSKTLISKREDPFVEEWIPKSSPYWE